MTIYLTFDYLINTLKLYFPIIFLIAFNFIKASIGVKVLMSIFSEFFSDVFQNRIIELEERKLKVSSVTRFIFFVEPLLEREFSKVFKFQALFTTLKAFLPILQRESRNCVHFHRKPVFLRKIILPLFS